MVVYRFCESLTRLVIHKGLLYSRQLIHVYAFRCTGFVDKWTSCRNNIMQLTFTFSKYCVVCVVHVVLYAVSKPRQVQIQGSLREWCELCECEKRSSGEGNHTHLVDVQ